MIRAVFVFPGLLALASCAGDPFGAKPAQAWPAATQVARGHIDFDWLLSGDRAVAPLQVFSDAGSTWLQFARGQSVPAIFAVVQGREAVVPYVWQEPYAVLAGRWPEIVLRGGRLMARARYGTQVASLTAPGALPALEAGREAGAPQREAASPAAGSVQDAGRTSGSSRHEAAQPGGASLAAVQAALPARAAALALADASAPGAQAPRYLSASEEGDPLAPDAVSSASSAGFAGGTEAAGLVAAGAKRALAPAHAGASALPDLSPATFGAGPQDVNMRRALTRWARLAGWTFSPQHWAVDADIPLAGSAELGADFKLAVNRLLESTELSDRPAHPCFYSNRVLRVLPLAEPCVRTAVSERPS